MHISLKTANYKLARKVLKERGEVCLADDVGCFYQLRGVNTEGLRQIFKSTWAERVNITKVATCIEDLFDRESEEDNDA